MEKESNGVSRREFAKAAALTTVAVLVPPGVVAQESNPASQAHETMKEKTVPEPAKLSATSQAEADLAYDTILRKFGTRFTEEQKAEIKRLVTQQQSSLDKLRAAKVTNADQPATVFQIYRGEGTR